MSSEAPVEDGEASSRPDIDPSSCVLRAAPNERSLGGGDGDTRFLEGTSEKAAVGTGVIGNGLGVKGLADLY